MEQMLLGMIAMTCFVAGLYFLRFWKSSRDRFFLFFAVAFWIEGMNRVILALAERLPENVPVIYIIRLCAFSLILYAIVDKNRPRKSALS